MSGTFFAAIRLLLVCSAPVLLMQPAYSQDAGAGRLKAEVACQTCHGVDGQATLAMVPNLSGQREDYTIIQLQAYRSGRRQHEQMSIISQSLSDEDIRNLAAWYASIKVTISVPDR